MGFLDKAKDMAGEHKDKVSDGLDKAKDMANEKTGGKFADKIDKAGDMVEDKLDE